MSATSVLQEGCTTGMCNGHKYTQTNPEISSWNKYKQQERKRLYLCCTVIPIIEHSTKAGNTAEGINNWGQ